MKEMLIKLFAGLLVGTSTVAAGAAIAKISNEHGGQPVVLAESSDSGTLSGATTTDEAEPLNAVAPSSSDSERSASITESSPVTPPSSEEAPTIAPPTQSQTLSTSTQSSIRIRHHEDDEDGGWESDD